MRYAGIFADGFRACCLIGSLLLTFAAGFVAWHSGYYEPFVGFQWDQAVVQVGLAGLSLIGVTLVILWTGLGMATSNLRLYWFWLMLWDLGVLLLSFCLWGYWSDVTTVWS